MGFTFPNLPKLSLWDVACAHSGQNATDEKPTNATRHKLAELISDWRKNKLRVDFVEPGNDYGFLTGLARDGNRAAADAEWRKLDRVTVRREDWERYQALQQGGAQHMDFISLAAALDFIVQTVEPPPGRTSKEDEPMWRASEAASVLHERLHNAAGSGPKWVELHQTTGKYLTNDAAASEGVSMLLHSAGWYDRELEARTRWTLDCVRADLDPKEAGPAPVDVDAGQWPRGKYFRAQEIGFDRAELSAFLQMNLGGAGMAKQDSLQSIAPDKARHIIEIPSGQAFINAADIPRWIAEKLTPAPQRATVVHEVRKRVLNPETGHHELQPLSEGEWVFLGNTWEKAGLQEIWTADPKDTDAYKNALEQSENPPEWELHIDFKHLADEAKTQRTNIQNKYFWAMDAAAKAGTLTLRDEWRKQILSMEKGALVGVEDARQFLEPLGFELREIEAQPARQDSVASEGTLAAAAGGAAKMKSTASRIVTRTTLLSAEIAEAKKRAGDNYENVESVWGELTKLAEAQWGILVGYSSDGVQYRGKKYEASQEPDVLKKKGLRERMRRAQRRVKAH